MRLLTWEHEQSESDSRSIAGGRMSHCKLNALCTLTPVSVQIYMTTGVSVLMLMLRAKILHLSACQIADPDPLACGLCQCR